EVAAIGADAAPERGPAAANEPDARAEAGGVLARSPLEAHRQPRPQRLRLIQVEPDRPVVVRDQHVDQAVVVDVAQRHSTADFPALGGGSGPGRDFLETTPAEVV